MRLTESPCSLFTINCLAFWLIGCSRGPGSLGTICSEMADHTAWPTLSTWQPSIITPQQVNGMPTIPTNPSPDDHLTSRSFVPPQGFYMGVSGGGISWSDTSLGIRPSLDSEGATERKIKDGGGIGLTFGGRLNDIISIQSDFAYYPKVFPSERDIIDESIGRETDLEDTVYLGGSLLLHYPVWRVLPYVGGGAAGMVVPAVENPDLGWAPYIQGGALVFVTTRLAFSLDIKHFWLQLQDNDLADKSLGALTYMFGLQYTF